MAKHFATLMAWPLLLIGLSGCATSASYPPKSDVIAATEAKPLPSDAIVTDPRESALYNAKVEAWGDRLRSAGLRLCRYFERTGMDVDCQ